MFNAAPNGATTEECSPATVASKYCLSLMLSKGHYLQNGSKWILCQIGKIYKRQPDWQRMYWEYHWKSEWCRIFGPWSRTHSRSSYVPLLVIGNVRLMSYTSTYRNPHQPVEPIHNLRCKWLIGPPPKKVETLDIWKSFAGNLHRYLAQREKTSHTSHSFI